MCRQYAIRLDSTVQRQVANMFDLQSIRAVLSPRHERSCHEMLLLMGMAQGCSMGQGSSPAPPAPGTPLTLVAGQIVSCSCYETHMAAVVCSPGPSMQHAPLQGFAGQTLPTSNPNVCHSALQCTLTVAVVICSAAI